MNRKVIFSLLILAVVVFMGWRFVRPMNIFTVSDAFERPVDTSIVPAPLKTLSAAECGSCHTDFYAEWRTTIHSQAWTDPYFQADWQFENSQQICRNCHTPLDRQQPHSVLGFRDREKWDPILEPNPAFDEALQHEGVTCAACHLREGRILGVLGDTSAPHPVKLLDDPNQICVGCHLVEGDRWDTFFRIPPCGTVAEIKATAQSPGHTGEVVVQNASELGCVTCHMPAVERPLVEGGEPRLARQHLWRGGHDRQMVKRGLKVELDEIASNRSGKRLFRIKLTNVGAAHYLPTIINWCVPLCGDPLSLICAIPACHAGNPVAMILSFPPKAHCYQRFWKRRYVTTWLRTIALSGLVMTTGSQHTSKFSNSASNYSRKKPGKVNGKT
jgi:hypothetical protein